MLVLEGYKHSDQRGLHSIMHTEVLNISSLGKDFLQQAVEFADTCTNNTKISGAHFLDTHYPGEG